MTFSSWSTSIELLRIFGDQLAEIGHPGPKTSKRDELVH